MTSAAGGSADDPGERLREGARLFDAGRYLEAHEVFEELWESTQGESSDFYKGLIQASIAMHHFREGNPDGARKLHSGHRRCLAGYLPSYMGIDVAGFLAAMQVALRPVLHARPGEAVPFDVEKRPLIPRDGVG